MTIVIIFSTCKYDELTQNYVTCYYTKNRSSDQKIRALTKYQSFPAASKLGFSAPKCFYYFYSPANKTLFTNETFDSLMTILLAMGYDIDESLAKQVRRQEVNVCVALRPKLKL